MTKNNNRLLLPNAMAGLSIRLVEPELMVMFVVVCLGTAFQSIAKIKSHHRKIFPSFGLS